MKSRSIVAWSAGFGAIAVVAGALGAHALEARLEPGSLESFQTAVRYQAWHALALLAIGFSGSEFRFRKAVAICWVTGIFLFSGSIYLLATQSLSGWDVSFLGPVTPIGGLFFIAGWIFLFIAALSKQNQSPSF